MSKITLPEKDFEKELKKLDLDLQEKIKDFKKVKLKVKKKTEIEFYLTAKNIARIYKQLSTDFTDKTIYTYLNIERRTFSRLRDKGINELNNDKEKKEETNINNNIDLRQIEETNENNKISEEKSEVLKRLEEIKQQNDKIISFYEFLKKKEQEKEQENENKLDKKETDKTDEEDIDLEDIDILEYPEKQLKSFRVNTWILGEFLKTAKKKGIKVGVATNKAFRMFIEKYS